MDKTKIDWCDSTWNPVTGCLHGCEYCYAKEMTKRFGKYLPDLSDFASRNKGLHLLDNRIESTPYPFGFEPTFHAYRLDDYAKKKGRNIFVCSMADLFGDWIPRSWIKEIFVACEKAPQHNYLFLTKNPGGFPRTSEPYSGVFGAHRKNYWFGTSITCHDDLEARLWDLLQVRGHTFLSIEPLHGKLDLDRIWVKNKEVLLSLPKERAYYFGGALSYHMPEWVIIGAETGSRKGKIIPERSWIEKIVRDCAEAGIPVFMKSSLKDIWGEPLIQEFPKELKGGQQSCAKD